MLCAADADITTEATRVRLQEVDTKADEGVVGEAVSNAGCAIVRSVLQTQHAQETAKPHRDVSHGGRCCCDRLLIHCDHCDSIT